jgi:hypothetical protein
MKDLIEIKFETKATISAGSLPKGLTDALQQTVNLMVPYVTKFLDGLLKDVEPTKVTPEK